MISSEIRRVLRSALVLAVIATVVVGARSVASADPGGVVISELSYHPASDLDADDFIELANTAGVAIDMSGWSFTAGISGTLPAGSVIQPGGYFVLSPDATSFSAKYGFAPDATYGGGLSNGGEQVTLADAAATVVDSVLYDDVDPWPATPDGTGPSLELRRLTYDNSLAESWGASTRTNGTPRAVNSIDGTQVSPKVTGTSVTPAQPDPAQPVVVAARLPIGSVATLTYKVMFGADVRLAFLDDAASPGGVGDGTYSAVIPGQTAGRLVRWRIDATTPGGVAFSQPVDGDSIHYEALVVKDPSLVSSLPVFQFFMEDSDLANLRTNHRYDNVTAPAVVAYGSQVIDNAAMRVRGNTSRSDTEVNWKVELPKGRFLDMGPRMPYPLDEFAVQSEAEPLADLGWNTVRGAGARSLTMFPVRTQRNGQFFSVGHIMELEDGTWRDAQGVDDWAIYKGNGGSLRRTSSPAALEATMDSGCPLCEPEQWLEKKTRKDEDFTDVWQLTEMIDAPPSATQREWIFRNVNIPEMVNYMAINSVIRHADSGWYNWWVARDTEGTGRWEMWHWDLNWIFTTAADDGEGTFLTPDTSNRFTRALLAYPDIAQMFYRRLRSLTDQFLLPQGKYEAMWDGIVNPYIGEWRQDRTAWGGYTPEGSRASFMKGLEDRYSVIAANTGPGKPVPASQSAAPTVVINEIQYAPAGSGAAEFIELANPSASEAVDISGWTVDGIGLTIPAGTVVLPGATVAFVNDDVTFRSRYSAANRFVGGEYSGDLSDTGETLRLLQGARVVDEVTYSSSAPWPAAAGGTGPSLELVTPTADNANPANWTAASTTGGTPAAANTTVVPPQDSVVHSDRFDGADGSPWPSAWTTSTTGGSLTLLDNAGRLLVNNTSGANARAFLSGARSVVDSDLVVSFQWNSANPNAYFNIYSRGSGGWANPYRPRNGYGVEMTANSSAVALKRVVNGKAQNLVSTTGAQQVGNQKQWLRLRTQGSSVRYRIWADGMPEPTGWTATATDSAVAGSGQVFLSLVRSGGATETKSVRVDDVLVTDLSGPSTPDTTPPSSPGTLSATGTTSTQANLAWGAATDNVAVAGYQIIRDGAALPATVTGLTFTDTNLTPASTYTYAVRAFDAAGLFGPTSNVVTVTTPAVTPTLYSDTFSGADGSSWAAPWTISSTGGAVNLQSGSGQLSVGNASGAYARAQLSGVAAVADADLVFSYQWNSGNRRGYFSVFTRSSGGWANPYRPATGYGLEFSSDSSSVTLKRSSGGSTSNLSTVGAQQVGASRQWVRLRAKGSTIQYRTWLDGTPEPTTWASTVTDNSVTAPGQTYLSLVRSGSSTEAKSVRVDDLQVVAN